MSTTDQTTIKQWATYYSLCQKKKSDSSLQIKEKEKICNAIKAEMQAFSSVLSSFAQIANAFIQADNATMFFSMENRENVQNLMAQFMKIQGEVETYQTLLSDIEQLKEDYERNKEQEQLAYSYLINNAPEVLMNINLYDYNKKFDQDIDNSMKEKNDEYQ